MIKALTAAVALTALASLASAAESRKMNDTQLDQVVAGNCGCHADNGWGNGADGINAGSDDGLTAPSKLAGYNDATLTGVNSNPTTSTGR